MFIELFGRKLFNLVTPYKRIFISIDENDYTDRIITIPSIKSAAFFFASNDVIFISSIDELEKLSWIDYDLLDPKDKQNQRFYEDFLKFKELVKISLSNFEQFTLIVNSKIIMSDVLHFSCSLQTPSLKKNEDKEEALLVEEKVLQ